MSTDEQTPQNTPTPPDTPRQRRFALVLSDLELLDVVGREWALVTEDGALFGPLSERQVDRLILRLERILEAVEPEAPSPQVGQVTLDLDPVPGPVPVARETNKHIDRKARCR